jgi:RNA polymerase sigma factor (sigma-70 family)
MQRDEIDEDFSRLYEHEAPRLWRAVMGYAGDRDVASDAVAEAFAQYLRRREAIEDAVAWLWQASFKIAGGELARRSQASGILPERAYEMPELASLFHTLRRLPPRQRAIVVLRYYVGYRPNEIAEVLGLTSATVRVHLLQAHRRLRLLLEGTDDA